jgi:hypothetical protein
LDRRIKADGAVQYRVRWSGYGAADDDWLDESALGNAQAKVALYNRRPAASQGRQEDGRDDTTDHDEDGDETEDEDEAVTRELLRRLWSSLVGTAADGAPALDGIQRRSSVVKKY